MTDKEAITHLVDAVDKTGLIIEAVMSYLQARLDGYTPEESLTTSLCDWDL